MGGRKDENLIPTYFNSIPVYEILEAARNQEKPARGEACYEPKYRPKELAVEQLLYVWFDFVNDILFGFATIAGYNKISGSGLIY